MLKEDLDILFSGPDAVEVTFGPIFFRGILDSASEDLGESMIVSASHILTGKTEDLKTITERDILSIDGVSYRVRKAPMKIDDGLLSKVMLGCVDE